jgi:hypothetical protein
MASNSHYSQVIVACRCSLEGRKLMFEVRRFALAVAAAFLALGTAALSVRAEVLTVNCSSSFLVRPELVQCEGAAQFGFQSDGPGTTYAVMLKAPTTHCSAVKYVVWRGDGSPMTNPAQALGQTQLLNPGQSGWVRVGNDLARGLQVVRITAYGQVGGCNRGTMGSWAVDASPTIIP